jgi:hypothetical protein
LLPCFYIFKLENKIYVLVIGSGSAYEQGDHQGARTGEKYYPDGSGLEISHDVPALSKTEPTFG